MPQLDLRACRRLAVTLWFLSLFGRVNAVEPKPILVVLQQDAWIAVIGSDSPSFVLYDDGTIIYRPLRATAEKPYVYRMVANASKTAGALLDFDPDAMKDEYVLTDASDQMSTVIWTPRKRIWIYGNWRRVHDPEGDAPWWKSFWTAPRSPNLPRELERTLSRIEHLRAHPGKPWLPKKIEVMFWPYENAPQWSIVWPSRWPSLSAPDTWIHGSDLFYSVYVPSTDYDELRKFLGMGERHGAILVDGHKMSAMTRIPFPAESAWMPRKPTPSEK